MNPKEIVEANIAIIIINNQYGAIFGSKIPIGVNNINIAIRVIKLKPKNWKNIFNL